jgi:lipopolysaccharide/colanic/teichoic acid biosynthesis glycosyltransferase
VINQVCHWKLILVEGNAMRAHRRDHDRNKRVVEAVVIPMVVVLLAPLYATVALCVLVASGRPILWKGPRVGKDGRTFYQYKFRTMSTIETDETGRVLTDAERVSPFGHLLRRTSLDELPQLFNVIKGNMSLVGPRPLPLTYLPRYTPVQLRRHEVRPGLTGLAQSIGRNGMPWSERFELDVAYVDGATFRTDLLILCRTVKMVLLAKNVSAAGYEAAPEFLGVQTPHPLPVSSVANTLESIGLITSLARVDQATAEPLESRDRTLSRPASLRYEPAQGGGV